ncbi:MAG: hypothetical protein R3F35_02525 [Myxococcota bacterium]
MARDEVRVSLFPFMSVLACTIGGLILLLTALSLAAVAPDAEGLAGSAGVASTANSATASRARPGPAGDAAASAADRRDGGAAETAAAERAALERIAARFAQLDRALEARGEASAPSLAELETRSTALARERRLERDRVTLAAEARGLAQARDTLEAEIAVLESRRETLPILIDPTGLARHLEPWFVECDAGGGTLLRAQDDLRIFVPRDELSMAGDFGRYLRRLRAKPGALLVLLVRPDGLATKDVAERVARQAGVRVAALPLPGRGELDWSLLRRAEGAGSTSSADAGEGES